MNEKNEVTAAYGLLAALTAREALAVAKAVALVRACCVRWRVGFAGESTVAAKEAREAFRTDVFAAVLGATPARIGEPTAPSDASAFLTNAKAHTPSPPAKLGELRCAACGEPPEWLSRAQADAQEARAEVERLRAALRAAIGSSEQALSFPSNDAG